MYSAAYHRISDGYITRIATTVDNSNLIYNVSQNAGFSYNTGIEVVWTQELSDHVTMDLNLNGYRNQIDAFTSVSLYPVVNTFVAGQQKIYSGNVKLNTHFQWVNGFSGQLTAIYLAPDIIPQGTIDSRFSLNAGVKKSMQKGKSELFFNAIDLLNTMIIRKTITGNNFTYTSRDYYETQSLRLGYNYKF